MTCRRCERDWEVDAYRDGRLGPKEAESFERHLRSCGVCSETLTRDERLRALGERLKVAEPGDLALRRLRARILRDVTTQVPSRSRRWWLRAAFVSLLGTAVTMATVVAVHTVARRHLATVSAPSSALTPLAATVSPDDTALWSQTREGSVERVELASGTLRVHVRPQGPGERFLVRLPDGEIEVRGTTFDVTTLGGRTRHVGVDEGTVVLRLHGSPDRKLGPGSSWSPTEAPPSDAHPAPTEIPSVDAPPAASPPRPEREVRRVADGGAAAYVSAMQSFREGHYEAAAAAFHAFELAFPHATEAEDASFLEALSLARAGRGDAAALAAERHLESFPQSYRRKEASILVARAASHRGRCDEALSVLAPWIRLSSDGEIRSVVDSCAARAAAR